MSRDVTLPTTAGSAGSAPAVPRPRLEIQRTTLSNGMVVVGVENYTHPSVVLRLNVRAAPALDTPDRAGLASLTASGLTRGTRTRSFAEINETVDAAGMGLSAGAGRHLSTVSARCLREDLPLAIELLADVTRNPIFPRPEIEQLRGQALTGLKQADDDTGAVADRRFRELLYPPGHPYRLRSQGYQETVSAMGPEDLAAFHAGAYGPEGAFCVVVGDVLFGDVVRSLEAAFGDWRGAAAPAVPLDEPPAPEPQQEDVVIAGKFQSDLVVGLVGIRRADPDYHALRMANLIFGQLGMMGRLGDSVREQQGLAYSIHSYLDASLGAGPWSVRAGVNPANVDAAFGGIRDQIRRLHDGGVTESELLRGQRYSTGRMVLQLETNEGVAGVIQDIEVYDLGLDYVERYPQIVNALTLDAVNEAAARRLPVFEDTVRVVAGPARS